MTELLAKTELDTIQIEYLNLIKHSGGILLSLVNDILDITRIESNRKIVDNCIIPFQSQIKSIFDLFKYETRQKGLIYLFEFDTDIPEFLICDIKIITQVLINLINNAIKFTNKGTISLAIRCFEINENEIKVDISVKDTGIGIDNDKIDTIFERFEQIDSSYQKNYAGTGLGLSIVKQLLNLINGTITVQSTPEAGSTFIVRTPLQIPTKTDLINYKQNQYNQDHQIIEQTPKDSNASSITKSTRILVAEDNAINLLFIRSVLNSNGFTVATANNGKEATDKFTEGKFECVIMDIQMPVKDGIIATKEIREFCRNSEINTKIIALTGYCTEEDKQRFSECKFDNYLSKPVDEQTLIRIIKQTLNIT